MIGVAQNVEFFSYSSRELQNSSPTTKFYAKIQNQREKTTIFGSSYNSLNQHSLTFTITQTSTRFVNFYASYPGYIATYYATSDLSTPLYQRNVWEAGIQFQNRAQTGIWNPNQIVEWIGFVQPDLIPSQYIFANSSILLVVRASSASKIQLYIDSEIKLRVSLECQSSALFETKQCCSSAQVLSVNISSQPFELKIHYFLFSQFPEQQPCFSIKLRNQNNEQITLGEEYVKAPTLLRSSPVTLLPLLNPSLFSTSLSKVSRILHSNINTKSNILSNQLQLGVQNEFTIHPFDLYNNSLISIYNFTFTIQLQGAISSQSNCSYSTLKWLYQCFIIPTEISVLSVSITYDSSIIGSFTNLTVIPGPYALAQFTINDSELNIKTCTAGQLCTFCVTARDSYGNAIHESPLLNSQINAFIIGPSHYASPIRYAIFNVTNDGKGVYSLVFSFSIAGTFQINIEVEGVLMFSQAKFISIEPADVSPFRSQIIQLNSSYRAGELALIQASLRDQFSNEIPNQVPLLSYFSQFPGTNLTISQARNSNSNFRVNLTFTPLITGSYELMSQILYKQEWTNISESPLKLSVRAGPPSTDLSFIGGQGTQTISLISSNLFYLRIYDSYNNTFDQEKVGDQSVYEVKIFGNSSIDISVNLEYSNSGQGYYLFSYSVTSQFQSIIIHASLYSDTSESYQPLFNSPLAVSLNNTQSNVIDDYNDLLLYNIGVTSRSEIILPTNKDQIIAGNNNVILEVIPRSHNGSLYFYQFYGTQVRIIDLQIFKHQDCICKNCESTHATSLSYLSKKCCSYDDNMEQCLTRPYCKWENRCIPQYCQNDCSLCNNQPQNKGLDSFKEEQTSGSYKLTGSLTQSGNYTALVSVWSFGGLRAFIYENPDFTYLQTSFVLNWLDHTFNSAFHSFFEKEMTYFSIKLFGRISALYTEPYELVIGSNLHCKIYVQQKLIFERLNRNGKPRTQKIKIEMERYRLYELEIQLISDSRQKELKISQEVVKISPYAIFEWSSPSQVLEAVKPRSLFHQHFVEKSTLGIIPGQVSVAQTIIEWPDSIFSEFFANQTYSLYVTPKDIFGNSRVTYFEDTVTLYLHTETTQTLQRVFQGVKASESYIIDFQGMTIRERYKASIWINGVLCQEKTVQLLA